MGKKKYLAGSVAATAGLLLAGSPAVADSVDNDGINLGNDNNASLVPIQLCGNDVAVLGAVVPLLSPEASKCVNAPVVDHPSSGGGEDKPEKPEKPEPEKPEKPEPEKPEEPEKPDDNGPDEPEPEKPKEPEQPDEEGEEDIPVAPTPESPEGHAAVTG
ncbi:hypothetical protein [Actinopolyspora mortivallis]|uniref:DUF320 domain-containing protein n=1 Tax=Actinopolyspora mortivallis TaxID=33906 RepID=A0A2T0GSP7_ACTMO|nr:hypothetical protein [Actinopolyspora mortivallis]PRW62117.1 hypothetical protein CEP50_17140 [Actinopolyspora mortivallis]